MSSSSHVLIIFLEFVLCKCFQINDQCHKCLREGQPSKNSWELVNQASRSYRSSRDPELSDSPAGAFHSRFHRPPRKIEKARRRRRSGRSRHSRRCAIHLEGNPADFSLILWRRRGGVRVYFSRGWRYLKNPPRNFFPPDDEEQK